MNDLIKRLYKFAHYTLTPHMGNIMSNSELYRRNEALKEVLDVVCEVYPIYKGAYWAEMVGFVNALNALQAKMEK